jgi:hypothetical protein
LPSSSFFFFNDTPTTEIYTASYTLSLHDALPIYPVAASYADRDGYLTHGRAGHNMASRTPEAVLDRMKQFGH